MGGGDGGGVAGGRCGGGGGGLTLVGTGLTPERFWIPSFRLRGLSLIASAVFVATWTFDPEASLSLLNVRRLVNLRRGWGNICRFCRFSVDRLQIACHGNISKLKRDFAAL